MEKSSKKYTSKSYHDFIEQCRNKDYIGLKTHIHHIQPRSQGGSDEPSNLITISVHDHFWAHVYYADEYNKCKTAPIIMLQHYKIQVASTEKQWDEAYRVAIRLMGDSKIGNKYRLGKKHTEESNEQNRLKHLGNKHTKEIVEVISTASKNMWDKRKSDPNFVGFSKGKKWFNNGDKNVVSYECPVGFVVGRLNGSQITKNGHKNRKILHENTNNPTRQSP